MKKLLIILTLLGFMFSSYAKADTGEEQAKQNSNTTQDIFTDDSFYYGDEGEHDDGYDDTNAQSVYTAKEFSIMAKRALENTQKKLGFLSKKIKIRYEERKLDSQIYSIPIAMVSTNEKYYQCLSIFKNPNTTLLDTLCLNTGFYITKNKGNFITINRDISIGQRLDAYIVLEMLDDKVVLHQYRIRQKDSSDYYKTIKILDLYKADKKNQLVLTKDNFIQILTKIEDSVGDDTIRQALLNSRITQPQKMSIPSYTPAQFADMAEKSLEQYKYIGSITLDEININSKTYPIVTTYPTDKTSNKTLSCKTIFNSDSSTLLDSLCYAGIFTLAQKDNYFTLEMDSDEDGSGIYLTRYITFKVLLDKVILHKYGVDIDIPEDESSNGKDKKATLILYKANKNNEIILGKDKIQEKLKGFESKVKDEDYAWVLDNY